MKNSDELKNYLKDLPGGEILQIGLEDLTDSHPSIYSYLVLIGSPRLERLGFVIPKVSFSSSPEHALFSLLEDESPKTAYSLYNSLIRRLVSLENALDLLSKSK